MSTEDDQTILISQKCSCAVSLGGVKKKNETLLFTLEKLLDMQTPFKVPA